MQMFCITWQHVGAVRIGYDAKVDVRRKYAVRRPMPVMIRYARGLLAVSAHCRTRRQTVVAVRMVRSEFSSRDSEFVERFAVQ